MGAKEDYIIANRLLVLDFLLSAEQQLNHPHGLCCVSSHIPRLTVLAQCS